MLGDLISKGWEQVAGLFGATETSTINLAETSDLHDGAKSGNVGKVQALLEHPDIQVNEEKEIDGQVHTPLLIAAKYGHHEVVELLLKVDSIQVNFARKGTGCTALYMAAQNGNLKVVEQLLKRRDIDVNKTRKTVNKTADGSSPLIVAAGRGHEHIVDLFLKRSDVDVNLGSCEIGVTPLLAASYEGHDRIVASLLKRDDIEVNKSCRVAGYTPLYVATRKGHVSVVKLLLKHKDIQVSKTDHNGVNAMLVALEEKDLELLCIIMEKAVKPVVENSECIVCLDRRPNVVLFPCGHQNLCSVCASRLKKEGQGCPIDRMPIFHVHNPV